MRDELNVRPATFNAAAEVQDHRPATFTVHPPERVEGRFSPSEPLPGGWFNLGDDSTPSIRAGHAFIGPDGQLIPRRGSGDSNSSILIPRRVESIMGEEDRKKYSLAQSNQRAAGGAAYIADQVYAPGQVYEMSEVEMAQKGFKEPVTSPGINRPGYQRGESSADVSPAFTPPLDGYFSPFSPFSPISPFSMPPPPTVHSRPSSLARVSVGSPLARISYMSSASSLEEQDQPPPSDHPSNTRRL